MDLNHWKYFLLIEHDFIETSRYVELTPKNFDTYSIEFTKIIFTSCSEIDVLCKQLCSVIGDPKADDIVKYRTCITKKFGGLPSTTIDVTPQITLQPWDKWASVQTPDWWKDYNSIKHERTINFERSNLKTTLNCVSALM